MGDGPRKTEGAGPTIVRDLQRVHDTLSRRVDRATVVTPQGKIGYSSVDVEGGKICKSKGPFYTLLGKARGALTSGDPDAARIYLEEVRRALDANQYTCVTPNEKGVEAQVTAQRPRDQPAPVATSPLERARSEDVQRVPPPPVRLGLGHLRVGNPITLSHLHQSLRIDPAEENNMVVALFRNDGRTYVAFSDHSIHELVASGNKGDFIKGLILPQKTSFAAFARSIMYDEGGAPRAGFRDWLDPEVAKDQRFSLPSA